jgi:mevalonate kinase
MAINRRLTVKFEAKKSTTASTAILFKITNEQDSISQVFDNIEAVLKVEELAGNEIKLFKHIYKDLIDEASPTAGEINIVIESNEIPIGAGLGSSAAYAAVLSATLLYSVLFLQGKLGSDASLPESFRGDGESSFKTYVWSYTNYMEKLSHGRPSGCDAATVIHGDCLVYKVGIPPNLTEVIKLPKAKIDSTDMFIVNTNAAKNTKDLVSRVKKFKEN